MKKKTLLIIILIFLVIFQPLLSSFVYADYDKKVIKIRGVEQYSEFSEINSGEAYLYMNNNSNKNGITVCVNAGHGTSGGEQKRTQCNPLGKPKITDGSTEAGATTAYAITSGMTFDDGTEEATVTLEEAKKLKDLLLKDGYDVLMIRETEDVQLDNIARTALANEYAQCHIAIHWDSTSIDKGAFYFTAPEGEDGWYKEMSPVKENWQKHEKLGNALLEGLRSKNVKIWDSGSMDTDLTQTSYSTIPSVDIELGDKASSHDDATLQTLAEGLCAGVNSFFGENPDLGNGGGGSDSKEKDNKTLFDIFFEPFIKKIFELIDLLKYILGDLLQKIINLLETVPSGTGKDFKITYTYDELATDGEEGNKNKYTLVSKEVKSATYSVPIDADEMQFTDKTEIPVIPVDLYTLANGKVHILDTNVLINSKDRSPITRIITVFIHLAIYISAAILIIMLIWHGINIVRTTINPKEKAEHKNKLYQLGKAITLLVGSVVIMALCIYSVKAVFKGIKTQTTDELPVRVNVEGEINYSFSTNGTGFVRYMSEMENTDNLMSKILWTAGYIILVWFNAFAAFVMIVRFIALMYLSIIGPLFSVLSMLDRKKVLTYSFKSWSFHYIGWSSIQLVLAVLYRMMLEQSIR